jgi:uncharacterized protein YbaA (DUF1428 family)
LDRQGSSSHETSFRVLIIHRAHLKEDEVVVFAYVLLRAHRDKVDAKAMAGPRLAGMGPKDMPFDGKRMF